MSPRKKSENTMYYALLGFFLEKPNYGYELYKNILKNSGFQKIWFLKQSQFYALLERLQNEGFLEYHIYGGDVYPDRKEYQLTFAGREKLIYWLTLPVDRGREMRQEFLVKLFFAMKLSVQMAFELVDRQKQECISWIREFQNTDQDNEFFDQLISQYRINQIDAMIDWLEYVRNRI